MMGPLTNPTEETNLQGLKYDQEKPRWELLAYDVIEAVVRVLTFGAIKYTARNWEKGIKFSRVFAATMRHLIAFWRGEDNDPETGLCHLDQAICELMFMSAYHKRGMKEFDDRPTK